MPTIVPPGTSAGGIARPGARTGRFGKLGSVLPLVLLGLIALSGCGAGAVSQTADQASGVNGAAGQVGRILVRNATIEFAGDLAGEVYRQGRSAPLSMSLVNTGALADRLVSASSPAAASVQVMGDAVLPGNRSVTVGNNTGTPSQALAGRTIAIKLVGLKQPVRAGLTYPVTLRFERAGEVTVAVPVDYPSGEFAERK